ncbi:hypothetical protein ACO0M4_29155 [Streptomyces sp. RGM 3693]|uniref:hypothetical protein n=1 Tax=Streptomyces sp. RGM 3693 TaxID=3413284 RepID=UPI003D27AE10
MGRTKPGKPRRRRSATYTLQQLQPPGYDEWFDISQQFTADTAERDPRLGEEAADLMQRIARLRPLYRGRIPMQAVQLDMLLDTGDVPISMDGKSAQLLPVESVASLAGAVPDDADVRESFHRLHAVGGILVEGEDTPVIRIVSQPPQRPGGKWIFPGDAEEMIVPQTCIPSRPEDLAPDEFAALGFIRMHMSNGTTADPAEFADHKDIGSVERARELFAAVAELAKVKGCSTCPSAHICTRAETDGAES